MYTQRLHCFHGNAQSQSYALASTSLHTAHSLPLHHPETIETLAYRVFSRTGTPVASNFSLSIYSNFENANTSIYYGRPNTLIGGPWNAVTWGGEAVNSGSLLRFDPNWASTTAAEFHGQKVWLVLKNNHATPASNYLTMSSGGANGLLTYYTGHNIHQGYRRTSADGITWTSAVNGLTFAYIKTSRGERGRMIVGSIQSTPTSHYGTREYGFKLTVPYRTKIFNVSFAGGITGTIHDDSWSYGILRDITGVAMPGTQIGQTYSTPMSAVAGGSIYTFQFPEPILLLPNKTYLFTVKRGGSQLGDSSNFVRFWNAIDYSPVGNTPHDMTEVLFDGTNWTTPSAQGKASAQIGCVYDDVYAQAPVGFGSY